MSCHLKRRQKGATIVAEKEGMSYHLKSKQKGATNCCGEGRNELSSTACRRKVRKNYQLWQRMQD
jgi:hypothetical protein